MKFIYLSAGLLALALQLTVSAQGTTVVTDGITVVAGTEGIGVVGGLTGSANPTAASLVNSILSDLPGGVPSVILSSALAGVTGHASSASTIGTGGAASSSSTGSAASSNSASFSGVKTEAMVFGLGAGLIAAAVAL